MEKTNNCLPLGMEEIQYGTDADMNNLVEKNFPSVFIREAIKLNKF